MNDLEALTFAQLCGELRVSAKTLRKVTKGNPDFPVLERGSSGRAYRFDVARKTGRSGSRPPGAPRVASPRANPVTIGGDTFPAAQLGNAVLTSQAIQDNAELFLRRMTLARGAADVIDNLLRGRGAASGFLSHLRSMMATMNQKSSVVQ